MLPFFKKIRGERKAQKPGRKDRKIQAAVEHRFSEEKYLKEHPIQITVLNGIVSLEGIVTSPLLRNLADEVAAAVPGVLAVQNNISLIYEQAASDAPISEASNTGDPNLHHPRTTAFTEVQPQTREDVIGGLETGIIANETGQIAIPATGEGSSVMDAGAVDAIEVSGSEANEDLLRNSLTKDVPVVDRDGKSVGRVKKCDHGFLLNRMAARDIYVPYFVCKFDGSQVIIDVLADEINDQGWAMPRLL